MDLIKKTPRMAGYTLLSGGGFALALAVDRLIVCPVLNQHLGSELFGGFMWTMGLVNLFGSVAANGFAILLLRDLAAFDKVRSGTFVRTALLLSGALSILILAGTACVGLLAADRLVIEHWRALFIPLGAYALIRSFELILFSILRVERRFATIFVLRVAAAAVLLCNLAVAPTGNLWYIGGIYCAAALAATGACTVVVRHVLWSRSWWDGVMAKALLGGWIVGATMTFSEQMQVYGSRLLLGVLTDTHNVTVLYAGTSIGNLFVAPIGIAGGVVLSMLAKHRRFVLGGRVGVQYLVIAAGIAACVGIASYVIGPVIVRLLYKNVSSVTTGFYHWIALANAMTAAALMLRPVAVKYLPLGRVLVVSVIIALVQLGALGVMIPRYGASGAAASLAASSVVATALWAMCFFFARSRGERQDEGETAPDVDRQHLV